MSLFQNIKKKKDFFVLKTHIERLKNKKKTIIHVTVTKKNIF